MNSANAVDGRYCGSAVNSWAGFSGRKWARVARSRTVSAAIAPNPGRYPGLADCPGVADSPETVAASATT